MRKIGELIRKWEEETKKLREDEAFQEFLSKKLWEFIIEYEEAKE